MQQVVIGTAGHIDHGKTSLVKALTGVDTDRLLEEKERGMTIDLGFAFLTGDITIIDVPGHERFIRNMVAGVSTIDIALVTIAADDGIMPQTKEHIEILKLLGVPSGCIALTKIDLVADKEWLELLEEEISDFVQGSFLEGVPVVRVSSETGEGIERIRSVLLNLASHVPERKDRGFFRLFVDRAFSMKGFGTVVTGTVESGRVCEGDEVELLPDVVSVKVRGIQSHGQGVKKAMIGDRAALNLSNVDRAMIKRGSMLASKGFVKPTKALGVELSLLLTTRRSIKHGQRVRVHIGTDEVMGRVFLAGELGSKEVEPGETMASLIRLESPVAVAVDDPFVLRFYSPAETIGGGRVLDPHPPARWKGCRAWIASLTGLSRRERFRRFLEENVLSPLRLKEWSRRWQLSVEKIRSLVQGLNIVEFGNGENPYITLAMALEEQKSNFIATLDKFHSANRYKRGIGRDELRQGLHMSQPLFDHIETVLQGEEEVRTIQGMVKRKGFRVELTSSDQKLAVEVENRLKRSRFFLLSAEELSDSLSPSDLQILQVLHILKDEGKIVEVTADLWIHNDNLVSLEEAVRDFFESRERMAVADFKELTKTTRKHAIPLLEYLDKCQVTRREGNVRVPF